MLGTHQVVNDDQSLEYVFCDEKGAWKCRKPTPKTRDDSKPIKTKSSTSLNSQVKKRVASLKNEVGKRANRPDVNKSSQVGAFLFAFDSYEVTESNKLAIEQLLPLIKGKKIDVTGYTDHVGAERYNDELAMNRASAVSDIFEILGIPKTDITIRGYGRCCYVSENNSESSRKKNRRVEVSVLE